MADTDISALLAQVPSADPSIDVTAVQLSAQDAFVLSRIDGNTPAGLIADMVALSPQQIVDILTRLEQGGAIQWATKSSLDQSPGSAAATADERGEPPAARKARVLDPEIAEMLAEPGDLTRGERLRILAIGRDLKERTYWDVLGLSGEPTPSDIKRAYFEASKRFHPDRHFGKKLGSFADRLDRVFHGIKQAYDVLGNDSRRAAYSEKNPPPSSERKGLDDLVKAKLRQNKRRPERASPSSSPQPDEEKRRRLEERRAEILAGRKKATLKPARDKSTRAREMYDLGLKQFKEKDLVGAAASFKIAMTYAPHNPDYVRNFEETNAAALEIRCRELIEGAELDMAAGRFANAAQALAHASDLLPDRVAYARRAAELFIKSDDRIHARTYAQRAVKCGPRRAEARILLAELLEHAGELESALGHYEVAASLDKAHGDVKKAIRRISKKLS